MRHLWEVYKELLSDALLIICGVILVYIFVTIEIVGWYGQEANSIIRRVELMLGILLLLLGSERFFLDWRQSRK